MFWVSKILLKKNFPLKKGYTAQISGKFFLKKNRKIQIFGRSAEIGQIFFGDKNLCIRRIFCINILQFEQ